MRRTVLLQDAEQTGQRPCTFLADMRRGVAARPPPAPLLEWLPLSSVVQRGKYCQPASPVPASALWELSSPPSSSIRDPSRHGLGADTSSYPGRGKTLSSWPFVLLKMVVVPSCVRSRVVEEMGLGAERLWESHGKG